MNAPMPPLGAWVELREEPCRGGRVHRLLVNRRDRIALRLTAAEARVCRPGPAAGRDAGSSGVGSSTRDVDPTLVAELRGQGFLADRTGADPATARATGWGRARRALATLDVHTAGANDLVAWVHRNVGRWFFTPAGVACQAAVNLLGLIALIHLLVTPHQLHLRVRPGQIPVALALSLLAIGVHELAHAQVVVHHGRRIDAVGVRLYLGSPTFYVESIDALLLTRRQRIVQALAGSWAEWTVSSLVAMWVWTCQGHTALAAGLLPLLCRFVVLNTVNIASNLMPFVGLDGFLVLADAIGEPDLAEALQGSIGAVVADLVAGRRVAVRRWLTACYATLNSAVGLALLLTSLLFWYTQFGGLIALLIAHGAAGWAVLALAAAVFLRPTVVAAVGKARDSAATLAGVADRVRFRLQTWWRVAAIERLLDLRPDLTVVGEQTLGVLAGRAERCRPVRCRHTPDVVHVDLRHRGRSLVVALPGVTS